MTPFFRNQNANADQRRDDLADKRKVKGGTSADDEGNDEVEREGEGRKECRKYADCKLPVHAPTSP